ncbi:MAG: (2Fe-2S)-binding protein [Deltaproteobacteria bacterium]|nr:(2Fe-2S)-binding protein [Deltaproteobacteria bacterium]
MPSVNIDGTSVEFKPGDSILKTAKKAGIEIPYYCWHPRLSVAANCRICLVELEKSPKLVPACQTPCGDGMVVRTKSDKVKETQKAVHEFLLINHPIDCPICDQAGECKLQNYYMKLQLDQGPMQDEKAHKPRLEELGPYVLYNGERCVMCTRCVRFMEEIAKDRQLGVFERGDHVRIGVFPNKPLDNPYSLNVVDVCPVGALTSSVFRFKQRVWFLSRSPSICPGCAKGCNVKVDHRSGIVYRLLPRENDAVNQSWLCDEGRLTYARANDGRLTTAAMLGPQGVDSAAANAALDRAIQLLKPVADSKQGMAAVLSLHATCEEAYLFGRFVKEVCGVDEVALLAYADGVADRFLRQADKNPNRAGVTRVLCDLGLKTTDVASLCNKATSAVKALLVLGHEGAELERLAAWAAKLEIVVQVAAARSPLTAKAHVTLPATNWVQADGTWQNGALRLQRLVPAFAPQDAARPAHEWLADLANGLGVAFALSSPATIRAEIERRLPSFAAAKISTVPAEGYSPAS